MKDQEIELLKAQLEQLQARILKLETALEMLSAQIQQLFARTEGKTWRDER